MIYKSTEGYPYQQVLFVRDGRVVSLPMPPLAHNREPGARDGDTTSPLNGQQTFTPVNGGWDWLTVPGPSRSRVPPYYPIPPPDPRPWPRGRSNSYADINPLLPAQSSQISQSNSGIQTCTQCGSQASKATSEAIPGKIADTATADTNGGTRSAEKQPLLDPPSADHANVNTEGYVPVAAPVFEAQRSTKDDVQEAVAEDHTVLYCSMPPQPSFPPMWPPWFPPPWWE